MKIYLAGPVDNCSSQEQTMWRHSVKQANPKYQYMDPMAYEVDFLRGKKSMDEIIQLEKQDIYNCDVLLAYPWSPSSGTAMEIMYAYMLNTDVRRNDKIKILAVCEKNKYLSPWISRHATAVFFDFFKAFEWIENNANRE